MKQEKAWREVDPRPVYKAPLKPLELPDSPKPNFVHATPTITRMSRTIIEVDPTLAEDKYDDACQSDTTSLASSVLNYVYENGRRFHGWREVRYLTPIFFNGLATVD